LAINNGEVKKELSLRVTAKVQDLSVFVFVTDVPSSSPEAHQLPLLQLSATTERWEFIGALTVKQRDIVRLTAKV
jgi:hypothetical protein